jgi:hypothetical protein
MEAGGEPTTELEELRNLEEVRKIYGWEADDKVYLKRQKAILQKWMAKEKNNTALVKLEGGGGASSSGLKKKKTLFDWGAKYGNREEKLKAGQKWDDGPKVMKKWHPGEWKRPVGQSVGRGSSNYRNWVLEDKECAYYARVIIMEGVFFVQEGTLKGEAAEAEEDEAEDDEAEEDEAEKEDDDDEEAPQPPSKKATRAKGGATKPAMVPPPTAEAEATTKKPPARKRKHK